MTKIVAEKLLKSYLKNKLTNITLPAYSRGDRRGSVYTSIIVGNTNIRLNMSCSTNSCGVYHWAGLPYGQQLTAIRALVKDDKFDDFIDLLFKESFRRIKSQERIAYITASTNKGGSKSAQEMLNRISTSQTDWQRNPNSGNQIKIWIL